jgi:hypothetical protein
LLAEAANTIFGDTTWRQRDAAGALRISPQDADRLGLADGSAARIATRRGSAVALVEVSDRMQPGHAALPNGFGLDLPDAAGATSRVGVAPNDLTELGRRDEFAGTPWHKHVPARIEPSGASRYSRGIGDSSAYPLPPRHSSASAACSGARLATQYFDTANPIRSRGLPARPRSRRRR